METLLTVEDIASMFRYTKATVWKKCRDNTWPYLQDGRTYRFTHQQAAQIKELMDPTPTQRRARNAKEQFKRNLAA